MPPPSTPGFIKTSFVAMIKKSSIKKKRSREETSLTKLAREFIKLLRESPGQRIHLNHAAMQLGVTEKRRLYDITGVLLGAQVISKPLRNIVLWTGGPDTDVDDLERLSNEIVTLKEQENVLEPNLQYLKELVGKIPSFDEAYVTAEDLSSLFKNDTAIFVKWHPSCTVHNMTVKKTNYTCKLKSTSGPIDLFLFSDDSKVDTNKAVITNNETRSEVQTPRTRARSAQGKILASSIGRTSLKQVFQGISNELPVAYNTSNLGSDASVLLRGLNPGPFQENELFPLPDATKDVTINFIPLEPPAKPQGAPIPSYRADSAHLRNIRSSRKHALNSKTT